MNQKPTKQKLYAAAGARHVPIVVSYGLSQIAHVNPIFYGDRVAIVGRERRELSHLWDSAVSASFPAAGDHTGEKSPVMEDGSHKVIFRFG